MESAASALSGKNIARNNATIFMIIYAPAHMTVPASMFLICGLLKANTFLKSVFIYHPYKRVMAAIRSC